MVVTLLKACTELSEVGKGSNRHSEPLAIPTFLLFTIRIFLSFLRSLFGPHLEFMNNQSLLTFLDFLLLFRRIFNKLRQLTPKNNTQLEQCLKLRTLNIIFPVIPAMDGSA
jgi:hypothetical protein